MRMRSNKRRTRQALLAGCFLAALLSRPSAADEVRVAVAANFADTLKALAAAYEAETSHTVVAILGSTGKHYAQIRNGAPFDVFLAADAERPKRLEEERLAVPGSRFTYALGRLVLWSPRKGFVDSKGDVLRTGRFRRLAIANPKLAPYGVAARQTLEALGLWTTLEARLVRGEDIGQAFQFVASGNAELGFVARSQIQNAQGRIAGSCWDVPPALHKPIEQQAVLLKNTPAARAFLAFLRGPRARAIIERRGYGVERTEGTKGTEETRGA